MKTDIGFLTIVSRSGAWTIVFTIFIIGGEVAWSSALQVQIICRKDGSLCGDLEERRQSQLPFKHQGQKKRENEQSSFITLTEFFPLIKSMCMSPQLRSKAIPLTSSDLSWPSMRSLQFNWGVYSIHTVTFIVNRPWFLFLFQGWWWWSLLTLHRVEKFSFKSLVVTHRKTSFRLRGTSHYLKAYIGECKGKQNRSHYWKYTDKANWASTKENMKGDSAILLQTLRFCTEESCAR